MPVGFPDYYGGLTLPVNVAEGGTGSTSVTDKAMLYGAGTSHLVETNVGTSGQVCLIDPVTLVPTFEDFDLTTASISGVLPLANGGTGTTTPALTAGTGISITGTWPDNTISNTSNYASLADPLPIAHGGTGTATPALTAGAGVTITGTWPNNTISATGSGGSVTEVDTGTGLTGGPITTTGTVSLVTPVAIANGGTGTATPALVAGANIGITGTWPDNTIALNNSISLGSITLTPQTDGNFLIGTASDAGPGTGSFIIATQSGNVHWPIRLTKAGTLQWAMTDAGDFVMQNPSVFSITNAGKITEYNGVATVGAGVPSIVAQKNLTGQTASIASTTIYTTPGSGQYKVSIHAYLNSPTGTSTLDASVTHTENGTAFTSINLPTQTATVGKSVGDAVGDPYCDSGTAITYATTFTSGGAGDSYDLRIRVYAE
jgi:hypothetical protein